MGRVPLQWGDGCSCTATVIVDRAAKAPVFSLKGIAQQSFVCGLKLPHKLPHNPGSPWWADEHENGANREAESHQKDVARRLHERDLCECRLVGGGCGGGRDGGHLDVEVPRLQDLCRYACKSLVGHCGFTGLTKTGSMFDARKGMKKTIVQK